MYLALYTVDIGETPVDNVKRFSAAASLLKGFARTPRASHVAICVKFHLKANKFCFCLFAICNNHYILLKCKGQPALVKLLLGDIYCE